MSVCHSPTPDRLPSHGLAVARQDSKRETSTLGYRRGANRPTRYLPRLPAAAKHTLPGEEVT